MKTDDDSNVKLPLSPYFWKDNRRIVELRGGQTLSTSYQMKYPSGSVTIGLEFF